MDPWQVLCWPKLPTASSLGSLALRGTGTWEDPGVDIDPSLPPAQHQACSFQPRVDHL